MASNFAITPTPGKKQKTDPAWQHCQMIKTENSTQLKCLYCSKVFKGGGIHRMKEHLAGHKGNGSICFRVPPDVRQAMREFIARLEPTRRKRKSKGHGALLNSNLLTDTLSPPLGGEADERNELIPTPDDYAEPMPSSLVNEEEGRIQKGTARRKTQTGNSALGSSDILETPQALSIRGLPNASNPNIVPSGKRSTGHVDMAIARFLFDIGAPLTAVNSPYFQPMLDAIASVGPNVPAPSYHSLRGQILKNVVEEVKSETANYSSMWQNTGCSLLIEEWKNESGRTFLSFSVHCPSGLIFLKGVTLTEPVQSSDLLVEVIKQVVEEVGVQNVVQVITSGEEHFADAGKKLMQIFPALYWAPCASQCIDLILEDFAKLEWVSSVIRQAQSMTKFIYNHVTVLNLLRKFTFGDDIIEPGVSQAAATFMTLKRMIDYKQNLQSMVTSEEWMNCPFSKKPEGLEALDTVTSQSFWSLCVCINNLTNSLLKLRRIVTSEKKAAMGYVYAGIYRVKEEIKKELHKTEEYSFYWDIIDRRWDQLARLPLHAAGFYLNPKFFYSVKGDMPGPIMSGMFDCIERLVTDIGIQDKIIKELNLYKSAAGDFGRNMAVRCRETLLPAEWWSMYGGSCPNLKRLAIRILGQTCSADVCKSLQISFDQIHQATNSLEHQRFSDLIYARCNLQLRADKDQGHYLTDPIASETTGYIGDWVNAKDLSSQDNDNLEWFLINPPSASSGFLTRSIDVIEDLGAGFDDHEIFERVSNGEQDKSKENASSERLFNF